MCRGRGRLGAAPLSLEDCFAPQGASPSDAVAADCLDGILPGAALPGVPPAPLPLCGSLDLDRCPSWAAVYDDPDNTGRSDQFVSDMAVSPDGSLTVVAAKDYDFDEADPYASTSAWALVAYDTATGAELWRSTWRSGHGYDAPGAVTLSPDGSRIYATGESYRYGNPLVGGDSRMVTIAYDAATGARLWRSAYNHGEGVDYGRGVATSLDGSVVYVTGVSTTNQADLDFETIGYSAADGKPLWARRYVGLGLGGVDSPFALGVDPQGRYLFVTGWSAGSAEFDLDYATIAYDVSGPVAHRAWTARYDGIGADLPDEAFALAVDPSGARVFVTGLSVGETESGSWTYGYGTVAYDAATGGELWRARWDGPGSGFNSATALAVSPDGGRVFVTGESANANTSRDWDVGTVAYDAASGAQLWARQDGTPGYDGEFALSIAAAPDGSRVYATGASSSSLEQGLGDALTIAYDAPSGNPVWQARLNVTGYDDDIGTVVHATPDGTGVVVSGNLTHAVDPSGRDNVYDVGTFSYASG